MTSVKAWLSSLPCQRKLSSMRIVIQTYWRYMKKKKKKEIASYILTLSRDYDPVPRAMVSSDWERK